MKIVKVIAAIIIMTSTTCGNSTEVISIVWLSGRVRKGGGEESGDRGEKEEAKKKGKKEH